MYFFSPYILWTLLSATVILVLWSSPFFKGIIVPLAIVKAPNKTKSAIFAYLLAVFLIAAYAYIHGLEEQHDLKIFYILLHFLLPLIAIKAAKNDSITVTDGQILFLLLYITLGNSIWFGFDYLRNLGTWEANRYRGFFPFPFFALLITLVDSSKVRKSILVCLIALLGFMLSGERGSTIIFVVIGYLVIIDSPIARLQIPLVFVYVLIGTVAYSHFVTSEIMDNVFIRALTIDEILKNLTWFGLGITPPLEEFMSGGGFAHFFVPADVLFLGYIYELGIFPFIIKVMFLLWLVLRFEFIRTSNFLVVSLAYVGLGYNLTSDLVLIAFAFFAVTSMQDKKGTPPTARLRDSV